MLKPYAKIDADITKKIFNYRLSRARRILENCFGIAAARFRVFRKPIVSKVENVITVVSLHNYLMKRQNKFGNIQYCPPIFVDSDGSEGLQSGDWTEEIQGDTGLLPLKSSSSNNYPRDAKQTRNDFKLLNFNSDGEVPWQLERVTRTIDPFDE